MAAKVRLSLSDVHALNPEYLHIAQKVCSQCGLFDKSFQNSKSRSSIYVVNQSRTDFCKSWEILQIWQRCVFANLSKVGVFANLPKVGVASPLTSSPTVQPPNGIRLYIVRIWMKKHIQIQIQIIQIQIICMQVQIQIQIRHIQIQIPKQGVAQLISSAALAPLGSSGHHVNFP